MLGARIGLIAGMAETIGNGTGLAADPPDEGISCELSASTRRNEEKRVTYGTVCCSQIKILEFLRRGSYLLFSLRGRRAGNDSGRG